MVIWLYINHILNNFSLIFFYLFIYDCVVINFVLSMAEHIIQEDPLLEEDHMATIPTVKTSALK